MSSLGYGSTKAFNSPNYREEDTKSGFVILFTTFMLLKMVITSHKPKVLITLIMDGGILAHVFINL